MIKSMKKDYDDLPQFDNSIFIEQTRNREGKYQNIGYYERGNMIGRTSFCQLYQVRKYSGAVNNNLGEVLMMKMIKKQNKHHLKKTLVLVNLQQYENEVMISKLVNNEKSKRFVRHLANWQNKNHFCIVYEKSQLGTLHELANITFLNNLFFKEEQILFFMKMILSGIETFHGLKIMHRDIKAQNIVIDQDFQLKIGQFGFAKTSFSQLEPKDNKLYGTPHYMAPQIMHILLKKLKNQQSNLRQYSSQVDIWSSGILLYYLIYRKYPFDDKLEIQYAEKIVNQEIYFQQDKKYQNAINILKKMLIKGPQKRLKAKEIINLSIIQTINMKQIKNVLLQKFKTYFGQKNKNTKHWTKQINRIPLKIDQFILKRIQNKIRVRIIKIYHDKRYGFFFLMSNFNFCAYFNDKKIVKFNNNCLNEGQQQGNYTKIMLLIYKRYFQSFCKENQTKYSQQRLQEPNCSIFKLSMIKNTLFIRLSNQVLQIFFGQVEKDSYNYKKCLVINSNDNNRQYIHFINKNEQQTYDTYQKGLDSQNGKYFEFAKRVLQEMVDNSIIPFQRIYEGQYEKMYGK